MWPLKLIVLENEPCSKGFNSHLWCFQGDRWENIHFESKPRHVIPQINRLVKTSPVLRVSIHINGVSKQIDGKTFILRVNLGMWPLKFIVSENMSPVLRVSTHIYVVTKEIDGKTFILRVNLRHVTPQIDCLSKNEPCCKGINTHLWGFQGDRWKNIHFESKLRHVIPQIHHLRELSPVLWVSTHIYIVSKQIDGKTFILRVNLGMWPLKLIISENQALFCGFQHTVMVFPWR